MTKKAALQESVLLAIQENHLRVDLQTGEIHTRRCFPNAVWRLTAKETVSAPGREQKYQRISFSNSQGHFRVLVHRAVWWAAGNTLEPGQIIDHKDNDPTNNCLTNLDAVTSTENNHRAIKTGQRDPRAKKRSHINFCKKLTPANVYEIRSLLCAGTLTQKAIAKQFGINQSEVSRIAQRTRYWWLP